MKLKNPYTGNSHNQKEYAEFPPKIIIVKLTKNIVILYTVNYLKCPLLIRRGFYYKIDNLICAVYNILMCWNTDYQNLVETKIVEMKKEKSKQSRQKWTAAKTRLPENYSVLTRSAPSNSKPSYNDYIAQLFSLSLCKWLIKSKNLSLMVRCPCSQTHCTVIA